MGEHFKCLSAIFPIIMRTKDEKKQVLLLRRENTGYMDGLWDFAGSGHVDENEIRHAGCCQRMQGRTGDNRGT